MTWGIRIHEPIAAGALHVLVATTVIEVGVDVSNATRHAELITPIASAWPSCMSSVGVSALARHNRIASYSPWGVSDQVLPRHLGQRLMALVRATDGFEIADEDLRVRGPGEYLGV